MAATPCFRGRCFQKTQIQPPRKKGQFFGYITGITAKSEPQGFSRNQRVFF